MSGRIPILILGGSDSRPGPVPIDVSQSRMLRGFKGAVALPNGRCLAQELVERIRGTDWFQDPVIVGPHRVYEGILDCRIVDVEGNLADTLRAVRTEVLSLPDLSQPVAFIACDILPTTDDFRQLLDVCYAPHSQCCFWGQLVSAEPAAMGASAWKPAYPFSASDGEAPQSMYPGHLVITRPAAVRMRLMNHLLQLAYRHRNQRLLSRPIPMLFNGLGQLIGEDLRNLLRGQLPVLSVAIPWHCLSAFLRFHQRRLSVPEFSRRVMKVFLHRSFHHEQPPAVVFSVTSLCAFAKDIDTTDELAEVRAFMAEVNTGRSVDDTPSVRA